MRNQRLVARGVAENADELDAGLARVLRHFPKRLKQRDNIDIENDMAEGRNNDLGTAALALLPHLGYGTRGYPLSSRARTSTSPRGAVNRPHRRCNRRPKSNNFAR